MKSKYSKNNTTYQLSKSDHKMTGQTMLFGTDILHLHNCTFISEYDI